MDINAVIYLINEKENVVDEKGDIKPNVISKRKVFGSYVSIRQSEFYQAQAVGLKPEIAFNIRDFEYKDEQKLEYNNVIYKILRTFRNKDGKVELICVGDIHATT